MLTNVHWSSDAKCRKPPGIWLAFILLSVFFLGALFSTVSAQDDPIKPPYFPTQVYSPIDPPVSNTFGILYNAIPVKLHNAQTYYHNKQDIWVTAYLPFIDSEYDPSKAAVPFGLYYTTGLALCSPKDESKKLYAPIEISTYAKDPQSLDEVYSYPFASALPLGTNLSSYSGPINTMPLLNEVGGNFNHPFPTEYGISALEAAQKFTDFLYTFFDHKGYDKEGSVPVKIFLSDHPKIGTSYLGEDVITVQVKGPLDLPDLSRSTIAHEMAHAIVGRKYGMPAFLHGTELHYIQEGFADIMGLAFENWLEENTQFENPNWAIFKEQGLYPVNVAYRPFDDPKFTESPNTYKGTYWREPEMPGFKPHRNGMVLSYWFYLLNSSKSGYIDDDDTKGSYLTQPLISGDKTATYSLALKIIFKTIYDKLEYLSGFPEVREKSLQATVELGYAVGSDVYNRVMTAWYAVGVGPAPYTSNQDCAVNKLSESWLNGPLYFNAQEATLTPDPASHRVSLLIDCSSPAFIETAEYNQHAPEERSTFMNIDPVNSQVYGKDNDVQLSKAAVSLHAFTSIARKWFKGKFGHDGIDGLGAMKLTNVLGDPKFSEVKLFHDGNGLVNYYPYDELSACRDEISQNYFRGVTHFVKSMNINGATSADFQTVITACGQIFSLEIKREFETEKQNPEAGSLWTLFEEHSDVSFLKSFSNPKLNGQPAMYNGANWSSSDPRHNSGFLNLFYYLLVHGTKDDNGQTLGYTNDEPNSKTYFVNSIDRDIVLRVLWDAYRTLSLNASVEEFRQATMSTLHNLDPVKYHAKSKEHIAFHDAWAAVLGLPDYASSLALYPAEGTNVYPWPVKVGAEAEYPLYESYRLFEVSKSSTFNESEHPVHRFVNGVMQINMDTNTDAVTYGEVNLEPGQTYWVRSHQADGPGARAHCATTDDPAFCESLLTKKKWTLPYAFKAGPVPAVVNLSPANGETVPAWSSIFSFGSTPGAAGYDMAVIDGSGTVSEQLVAINSPYDYEEPEQSQVIETTLALSKEKPYTYRVAPRQKLGSDYAVHVLPNGIIYPFTEAEKEAFPDVYGDWTGDISIKTDLPSIELQSPADGAKVPLFGPNIFVKATKEAPERADYYQYSFREPVYTDKAQELEAGFIQYPISVQGLIGLEDKKSYEWTFIQRKKVTPPFILEEEEGASPGWFSFIVDKDLTPKPEVEHFECVQQGSQVALHWKEIPGAQSYRVTVTDAATQGVVANFQTGYTLANINGVSEFPKKYVYTVEAGVMSGNGEWIFGPKAVGDYAVLPPSPSNLTPNNVDGVKLGANNSVVLSWELPAGVTTVQLMAKVDGAPTKLVDQAITGTSFTLNNLEFNSPIFWTVTPLAENSCMPEKVTGFFNTDKEPMEFDLGFELRVDNNDPNITGGFYHYLITVHRPDGEIGFSGIGTVDADTWLQVGFVPGEGQLINGNEMNGQLLDQPGDYVIELEILDMAQCDSCSDPKAHPVITVAGVEYKRKIGEEEWSFSREFHPEPSNPVFPSRTIGAKKIIKFHYEFPN